MLYEIDCGMGRVGGMGRRVENPPSGGWGRGALLWVVWLLVLGGVVEAAPTVTNVRAAQRAGTKLVDVDYDLAGASGTVNAFLRVSADGGVTWTVPVTTATGAVGSVTGGTDKRITWDAGVDWNGRYNTQMRFRVLVDDLVAPTDFVTVVGGTLPVSSPLGAVAVGPF